jgi:hypothetical protein
VRASDPDLDDEAEAENEELTVEERADHEDGESGEEDAEEAA